MKRAREVTMMNRYRKLTTYIYIAEQQAIEQKK